MGVSTLTRPRAEHGGPATAELAAEQAPDQHLEQVLQVLSAGLVIVAFVVLVAGLVVALDPGIGLAWPAGGRAGSVVDHGRGQGVGRGRAAPICLNLAVDSSLLSGFLSGWCWSASLRYAFLASSSSHSSDNPRISNASSSFMTNFRGVDTHPRFGLHPVPTSGRAFVEAYMFIYRWLV